MQDFFEQIGPWGWVLVGLVLLVLEIFLTVPGSLFLFTGIAALIIGISAILFDWAWQYQLIVFGILSVALVMFGRRYFARPGKDAAAEKLNVRAASMIGSAYMLVEPIVGGRGRIKVGDSTWGVTGPDTSVGSWVRVVAADGATLVVEPADAA